MSGAAADRCAMEKGCRRNPAAPFFHSICLRERIFYNKNKKSHTSRRGTLFCTDLSVADDNGTFGTKNQVVDIRTMDVMIAHTIPPLFYCFFIIPQSVQTCKRKNLRFVSPFPEIFLSSKRSHKKQLIFSPATGKMKVCMKRRSEPSCQKN